jgi:hypothetical protein
MTNVCIAKNAHTAMVVGWALILSVVLSLISQQRAWGRIPDVSKADLEKGSTLIVEGKVLSSKLLKHKVNGPKARTIYESQLKIFKVAKGNKQVGEVIKIRWSTLRWVGKGRRPPGHWIYPVFCPCAKVAAYLYNQNSQPLYSVVAWNGMRVLKRARPCRLPQNKGAVEKCTNGKSGTPKSPAPTHSGSSGAKKRQTKPKTASPSHNKSGCAHAGKNWGWSALVTLATILLFSFFGLRRKNGQRNISTLP